METQREEKKAAERLKTSFTREKLKKNCRSGVYEEQIEEKEKDLRYHSEEGLSEQGAEREEQKQPAVDRRDDQSERYRLFSHTCPN